ncbi:MAG: gamma-glutamylcyclotransferase family protein [Haloarculaceae archaeon]
MEVFVYGTLTEPARADSVLHEYSYRGPAVLEGFRRVEGEYPTLAPGGSVAGRLLTTGDVGALDRYESVTNGLYVRVSLPLVYGNDAEGGSTGGPPVESVEVYVGDPDRLDADADWPGDGSFAERVLAYLVDSDVRVRCRRGTFRSTEGEGDPGVIVDEDARRSE